MNIDQAISILKFLNNKKSERIIRRVITHFLCIVITIELFSRIYFRFTIEDLLDYKKAFTFFTEGSFVVPAILYLLVFFFTKWIFIFYNSKRHSRIEDRIDALNMTELSQALPQGLTNKELVDKVLSSLFRSLKGLESGEERLEFKRAFFEKGAIIEEYLILIIRLLAVDIIGFINTPYYGTVFLLVSLLMITVTFAFLMVLDFMVLIIPRGTIKLYTALYKKESAPSSQTEEKI